MTITGQEARELGEALIDAADYIAEGVERVAVEAWGATYLALPEAETEDAPIVVEAA